MKQKVIGAIILGLFLSILLLPSISSQSVETTTLEITNISGGIGGVTVEVQNTGTVTANDLWVTTTISGGIFGNINIRHQCTGCSSCGTSLDPGMIKTENTLEARLLLGIGPIQISTLSGANNADDVFMEKTGFAIGPLVIV